MATKQLIEEVASEFNLTKKATGEIVAKVFASLKSELDAEGKVKISGLGTFTKKDKAARKGRNPKTGESIDIPAKTVVSFKPAKEFKELVA